MKNLKKLLTLSLALATVSGTAIFADESQKQEVYTTGNSQIYTFTFDAPTNGNTKDFVTRNKISDTNHGHIKLNSKPSNYNLNTVFIKGYGGNTISGVKVISNTTEQQLNITNLNDYKKGSKISTRLKNNSNIGSVQTFKGTVNYH